MKRYQVIIQPDAERELREAFEYIRADSPKNAAAWLLTLYDTIHSLETMPQRFGFARERDALRVDVRQFVHHSHRVLYVIEGRKVFVLHVRHASRDALLSDDDPV